MCSILQSLRLGLVAFLFYFFLPFARGHIWAWLLSIPYNPPGEGPLAREVHPPLNIRDSLVSCDHDRSCGKGFSCDRHFLVCVPLKQAGQYCRRDAQCLKGLTCMFGKCHHSIPEGQEGARCKLDKDCGGSMCCARHHGEMICKRRLMLGESCFVPDGGLAFSINQICPCEEGLLCRKATDVPQREKEFVYRPEVENWQCQAPAV
ncbi:dickkopf-related protein 3-like isoform X1 [Polypterus senegalus]|nr:dickkopf-related protein 3-like isoform X1 [Polypterus senegalus]